MKKLLSIIAAGALVSTAGSSLVSCGMSPQKIMNRIVNDKEYKGFLKSALTTWSYPSTQQAADMLILENIYDGLLTPNSSGVMEGQLADWWGHNEAGDEYYFHIRDEEVGNTGKPVWTKVKNGKVLKETTPITPQDFFNSFRFSFNPNASADGASPTNDLFKNGPWLVNFLNNLKGYDEELKKGEFFKRTGDNTEGNVGREANSTWNYDISILLINLLTAENPEKISQFKEITWLGEDNKYQSNQLIEEFLTEILRYKNAESFASLLANSQENGGMMSIAKGTVSASTSGENGEYESAEQEFNVKYVLENPSTSFFESASGYGSLKPVPSFAVNYEDSRSWYNFSKRYQPGKDEMWFSGAYYVESYNASSKVVLKKNPNYYQKDKTYIEKATYILANNESVDSKRLWFEGGDSSDLEISPNDAGGWKKYVGDNYDAEQQNFAFEGTHATTTTPSQYTFTTFFNYGRTDKETISNSSVALAQKSTRLFINYFMQRNQFPSYVAGRLDNKSNTSESLVWDRDSNTKINSSTLLRNVFTIPRLSVNESDEPAKEIKGISENDYTIKNVGALYNEKFGTTNLELTDKEQTILEEAGGTQGRLEIFMEQMGELEEDEKQKIVDFYNKFFGSLIDGNDTYYQNDLMALGMFLNDEDTVKTGYEDLLKEFANTSKKYILEHLDNEGNAAKQKEVDIANEQAKAKILGEVVKKDWADKNLGFTQVNLEWILNAASRMTLNPRIEYLIDRFNASVGSSSPILLKALQTTDQANYLEQSRNGNYDIYVSGWGPDYTDPYNFLSTLSFRGPYDVYTNTSKVLDYGVSTGEGTSLKVKDSYSEKYSKAYEDLIKATEEYTDLVEKAKEEPDFSERLKLLSEAEVYGLYDQALTTPLYNKNPIKTIQLSYLDPFTRSSYISGNSSIRLFGVKMISKLWNKQQFLEAQKNFELSNDDPNKKAEYKNLYNWNKSSEPVTVK